MFRRPPAADVGLIAAGVCVSAFFWIQASQSGAPPLGPVRLPLHGTGSEVVAESFTADPPRLEAARAAPLEPLSLPTAALVRGARAPAVLLRRSAAPAPVRAPVEKPPPDPPSTPPPPTAEPPDPPKTPPSPVDPPPPTPPAQPAAAPGPAPSPATMGTQAKAGPDKAEREHPTHPHAKRPGEPAQPKGPRVDGEQPPGPATPEPPGHADDPPVEALPESPGRESEDGGVAGTQSGPTEDRGAGDGHAKHEKKEKEL